MTAAPSLASRRAAASSPSSCPCPSQVRPGGTRPRAPPPFNPLNCCLSSAAMPLSVGWLRRRSPLPPRPHLPGARPSPAPCPPAPGCLLTPAPPPSRTACTAAGWRYDYQVDPQGPEAKFLHCVRKRPRPELGVSAARAARQPPLQMRHSSSRHWARRAGAGSSAARRACLQCQAATARSPQRVAAARRALLHRSLPGPASPPARPSQPASQLRPFSNPPFFTAAHVSLLQSQFVL